MPPGLLPSTWLHHVLRHGSREVHDPADYQPDLQQNGAGGDSTSWKMMLDARDSCSSSQRRSGTSRRHITGTSPQDPGLTNLGRRRALGSVLVSQVLTGSREAILRPFAGGICLEHRVPWVVRRVVTDSHCVDQGKKGALRRVAVGESAVSRVKSLGATLCPSSNPSSYSNAAVSGLRHRSGHRKLLDGDRTIATSTILARNTIVTRTWPRISSHRLTPKCIHHAHIAGLTPCPSTRLPVQTLLLPTSSTLRAPRPPPSALQRLSHIHQQPVPTKLPKLISHRRVLPLQFLDPLEQ